MAFAARPKVVAQKAKFREEEEEAGFQMNNLMWDKRVVRGNTYASIVATKTIEPVANFSGRHSLKKSGDEEEGAEEQKVRKRRVSIEIVTDEAVESMTDKPPVYEKDTQTEAIPEKPVVRLRMREKTGTDCETQILDSDLFNFNYEVEPLLRVLIGKTLERSRLEVLQETELEVMQRRQSELKDLDEQEARKVRAMEQKERKMAEENEAKKAEYRKRLERSVYIHKKLLSRTVAKKLMLPIWPDTKQQLTAQGLFTPAFQFELYEKVLPALYSHAGAHLSRGEEALELTKGLAQEQVKGLLASHAASYKAECDRRALIVREREERQREKEQRRGMRQEDRRSAAFEQECAQRLRQQQESQGKEGEDNQQQDESKPE